MRMETALVSVVLAILSPFHAAFAHEVDQPVRIDPPAPQGPFISNAGQIANSYIRFYAHVSWGSICLTDENQGSIDYVLPEKADAGGWMLRERFVNARPMSYTGQHLSATIVHFFIGNDPSAWRKDVATWTAISAGEIYPEIELSLQIRGSNVEKLFVVRPGGDPSVIQGCIEGAGGIQLERGALVVRTERGDVRFSAPRAFQKLTGVLHPVEIAYRLTESGYGFDVGHYDREQPLIIDPLLASTFIGGGNLEEAHACVVSTNGNVYIAGQTMSSAFPTKAGCYRTTFVGGTSDAFVSCLNSNLTNLIYSTFLGGTNGNEQVDSILLTSAGDVIVAGSTMSTNFPTTVGAYDRSFNGPETGSSDLFVSRLDAALSTLKSSTFLGGVFNETDAALAFNPLGQICVAAQSVSTNYPVSSGAFMTNQSGMGDAVVTVLTTGLSALVASTYLGGESPDRGNGIAVDSQGNIYVTGPTSSPDFPTTPTAFSTLLRGSDDAFVSKLNSDLSALLESTYLGGTGSETGQRLALDRFTNVLVSGYTSSSNFPTRTGGFSTNYHGGNDVFVAKLPGNLRSLTAGVYLGGDDSDTVRGMTMDNEGHVWIVGVTSSTNFPVTGAGYDRTYNGGSDMFIARIHNTLSNRMAATYLGGTDSDSPWGIALDKSTNVYMSGGTSSSDYPTAPGAYDRTYAGNRDGCVTKLNKNLGADEPIIVNYEVVRPDCLIHFLSETGYLYRLQYSTQMTAWSSYTYTNGTGGTNVLIDRNGAAIPYRRNYDRVIIE